MFRVCGCWVKSRVFELGFGVQGLGILGFGVLGSRFWV